MAENLKLPTYAAYIELEIYKRLSMINFGFFESVENIVFSGFPLNVEQ